ncbi:hypothetical protein BCON_0431g00060 [Botryotinia convoluta]|uniref:Uncharacterized protein n=1 Tax=Botryotinia convoluta TaxID=54673 RepID=A0A4Z1H7C3_9HELO|nr:hypothetical protein BCON_0431g00060 [Botryotinia convoluta]
MNREVSLLSLIQRDMGSYHRPSYSTDPFINQSYGNLQPLPPLSRPTLPPLSSIDYYIYTDKHTQPPSHLPAISSLLEQTNQKSALSLLPSATSKEDVRSMNSFTSASLPPFPSLGLDFHTTKNTNPSPYSMSVSLLHENKNRNIKSSYSSLPYTLWKGKGTPELSFDMLRNRNYNSQYNEYQSDFDTQCKATPSTHLTLPSSADIPRSPVISIKYDFWTFGRLKRHESRCLDNPSGEDVFGSKICRNCAMNYDKAPWTQCGSQNGWCTKPKYMHTITEAIRELQNVAGEFMKELETKMITWDLNGFVARNAGSNNTWKRNIFREYGVPVRYQELFAAQQQPLSLEVTETINVETQIKSLSSDGVRTFVTTLGGKGFIFNDDLKKITEFELEAKPMRDTNTTCSALYLNTVARGTYDGTIVVDEVDGNQLKRKFEPKGVEKPVFDVSMNKRYILACGYRWVMLWDLDGKEKLCWEDENYQDIQSITLYDSKIVACSCEDIFWWKWNWSGKIPSLPTKHNYNGKLLEWAHLEQALWKPWRLGPSFVFQQPQPRKNKGKLEYEVRSLFGTKENYYIAVSLERAKRNPQKPLQTLYKHQFDFRKWKSGLIICSYTLTIPDVVQKMSKAGLGKPCKATIDMYYEFQVFERFRELPINHNQLGGKINCSAIDHLVLDEWSFTDEAVQQLQGVQNTVVYFLLNIGRELNDLRQSSQREDETLPFLSFKSIRFRIFKIFGDHRKDKEVVLRRLGKQGLEWFSVICRRLALAKERALLQAPRTSVNLPIELWLEIFEYSFNTNAMQYQPQHDNFRRLAQLGRIYNVIDHRSRFCVGKVLASLCNQNKWLGDPNGFQQCFHNCQFITRHLTTISLLLDGQGEDEPLFHSDVFDKLLACESLRILKFRIASKQLSNYELDPCLWPAKMNMGRTMSKLETVSVGIHSRYRKSSLEIERAWGHRFLMMFVADDHPPKSSEFIQSSSFCQLQITYQLIVS